MCNYYPAGSWTRKAIQGSKTEANGKFTAEICDSSSFDKNRVWLGIYKTAEEAAWSYDRAAFRLRAQNAKLNFPILFFR